ncbi:uncharacterized protein LOC108896895 isoform X2 [Lates calcarifer]|uniref:Uncharacterized protein LOC108896895 isoform X2 n=1 Tax=Lates calcarifer TaxID=8187 RepID=A0AAJ8B9T4_LATCA|nr:uncharacterized protein LOC108896895 isoform X2 [Lates calcarifer]
MDNGDTCSLWDNEKMDANTVWQWRIMHANKYSEHTKPFHYSKEMGLDFTVGSNTQEKMDLQLVTNGVILEVCDFAKMVKKSKRHFITNILENNFDLGLKNEQQRITFTSQILHKVKDLIQKPPKDKHEAFTLFDMSSKTECASSSKNGLNMASIERNTDSFQVDMDDTDGNEHEEVKCSLTPSKENIKTEEMDGPCADDSDDEDEFDCSGAQSTKELGEDVLPPLYPCCKEIGLNLDVGSNQSLDPGLLTKGVMLELAHFTRVLTGSYRSIVLDVLEHNFELDLNSQQGKGQVWSKIVDLLKRRERLITEFKSELFSFQTNPIKRQSASTTVRAPQHQFNEVTKRMKSDLKSKKSKRAPLRTS